jgi:hypothetical protein
MQMSYAVGQLAQTAAVVAAIALFIFRPDWSEDRPLLTGPPVAPPLDGMREGVFDTKLTAPDWPVEIAAASLVLMPTETSKSIETSVKAPPKGGKGKLVVKAKPRADMPTATTSTEPRRYLQLAKRGGNEVKH